MNLRTTILLAGAFLLAHTCVGQIAPTISKQPVSVNTGRGGTARFSVTYAASYPTLQWMHDSALIPGATNASLVITNVQALDAGAYSLLITNTWGEKISSNATLVVGPVTYWGNSMVTNIPLSLTNVAAIAAGEYFMMALTPDGQVSAWSQNGSSPTNIPPSATNIVAISAGRNSYVLLRSDGTVILSAGTAPAYVTNIVDIAAGYSHSVGLRANGTVVAWNSTSTVLTNAPAWVHDAVGISASETYSLAVRRNGKVQYWGAGSIISNFVSGASDIISAAAGPDHCLLLKMDGSVVAGGANTYGQTNVPVELADVVAVSAGPQVSYALKSDGTVVAWGRNTTAQTNIPPGLGAASAIATKINFSAAIAGDGSPSLKIQPMGFETVAGQDGVLRARVVGAAPLSYQWYVNGAPVEGATNADLFLSRADAADSGAYYVAVTNSMGSVTSRVAQVSVRPWTSLAVWGLAGGVAGDLPSQFTEFTQVSAGFSHCVGLTREGTAVCWGDPSDGKCNVPAAATNLIGVVAGVDFSAAVQAGATIFVWGETNSTTPLKANTSAQPSRKLVPYSTDLYGYGLASLKPDGTVGAWSASRSSYTSLSGFTGIRTICSGMEHVLGLRSNGTVVVWSPVPRSYYTPPENLSNVVAIAAGEYFCLALRDNGTVVSWGVPAQTTAVPADLTNAVMIAAGGQWSLAKTSDGRLVSWGPSPIDPETFSSLAVPNRLDGISAFALQRYYGMALTTNRFPCITLDPRSRAISPGWAAQLQSCASGEPPLSWQWQRNGLDIPGATARTLTVTNLGASDGEYCVVVTNLYGSATSAVARLTTGNVLAWGGNTAEQCWVPSLASDCTKISAGTFYSAALLPTGRIQAWGGMDGRQVEALQSLTNVVDINCGGEGGVAFLPDGSVGVWGSRLTTTNVSTAQPVISADMEASGQPLGVLSDGSLVSWNTSAYPWNSWSSWIDHAVQLSAGSSYALVLGQNGRVGVWGLPYPAAAASQVQNAVQVAAGSIEGWALLSDGTVVSVKTGLAVATGIASISAGDQQVLALHTDGTVSVLGQSTAADVEMAGALSNVVEVAAGFDHNMVRFGNGSPNITVNPFSRAVRAGTNTLLSTFAVGAQPMHYQWQRNGIDLPGETNPSLLLTLSQLSTAGNYRCIVTNAMGSVTGQVATVSVVFPPPRLSVGANPSPISPEGFTFTISELSGQGPLVVYSSTNLVDWAPIHTNAPGSGALEFTDPAGTNAGPRYYRASELR